MTLSARLPVLGLSDPKVKYESESGDFVTSQLDREDVESALSSVGIDVIGADSRNKFWSISSAAKSLVYVSQCKSSEAGRGNWDYVFFHTIPIETLMEICNHNGMLVLLNYSEGLMTVLRPGDLIWISRYSSRNKSNAGVVCDFVIDKSRGGEFQLRPYDRMRPERLEIEVIEIEQ